jgi:hypothetical protein
MVDEKQYSIEANDNPKVTEEEKTRGKKLFTETLGNKQRNKKEKQQKKF